MFFVCRLLCRKYYGAPPLVWQPAAPLYGSGPYLEGSPGLTWGAITFEIELGRGGFGPFFQAFFPERKKIQKSYLTNYTPCGGQPVVRSAWGEKLPFSSSAGVRALLGRCCPLRSTVWSRPRGLTGGTRAAREKADFVIKILPILK